MSAINYFQKSKIYMFSKELPIDASEFTNALTNPGDCDYYLLEG